MIKFGPQTEMFLNRRSDTSPRSSVARILQGNTVRGREASEAGDLNEGTYCKLQSIIHFAGAKDGSRWQGA